MSANDSTPSKTPEELADMRLRLERALLTVMDRLMSDPEMLELYLEGRVVVLFARDGIRVLPFDPALLPAEPAA